MKTKHMLKVFAILMVFTVLMAFTMTMVDAAQTMAPVRRLDKNGTTGWKTKSRDSQILAVEEVADRGSLKAEREG